MVGTPNFFSSTTLRPRGPRVTLTELASLSTPASSDRRALSPNFSILGMSYLLACDGEDVTAGQDEQILTVDRDLGAAVLAVDDGVAHLDVEGDDLARLLRPAARAHGQYLALLGLLLGRVGDDQPADGGLLSLVGADDDAVVEGLEVHIRFDLHRAKGSVSTLTCRVLTIAPPGRFGNRAGSPAGQVPPPARGGRGAKHPGARRLKLRQAQVGLGADVQGSLPVRLVAPPGGGGDHG